MLKSCAWPFSRKSLAPRTHVTIIARTESCSSAVTRWPIGWARIPAPSSAGYTVSRGGASPGCEKESARVGPRQLTETQLAAGGT